MTKTLTFDSDCFTLENFRDTFKYIHFNIGTTYSLHFIYPDGKRFGHVMTFTPEEDNFDSNLEQLFSNIKTFISFMKLHSDFKLFRIHISNDLIVAIGLQHI